MALGVRCMRMMVVAVLLVRRFFFFVCDWNMRKSAMFTLYNYARFFILFFSNLREKIIRDNHLVYLVMKATRFRYVAYVTPDG